MSTSNHEPFVKRKSLLLGRRGGVGIVESLNTLLLDNVVNDVLIPRPSAFVSGLRFQFLLENKAFEGGGYRARLVKRRNHKQQKKGVPFLQQGLPTTTTCASIEVHLLFFLLRPPRFFEEICALRPQPIDSG